MNPDWNEPDLRIIVVVQDMGTKVIHQATLVVGRLRRPGRHRRRARRGRGALDPDRPRPGHRPRPRQGHQPLADRHLHHHLARPAVLDAALRQPRSPDRGRRRGHYLLRQSTPTVRSLTSTAGPLGNTASGQAVSFVDFDGDGDLDIHVANEGAADQLLRNDGTGCSTDIASGPIAEVRAQPRRRLGRHQRRWLPRRLPGPQQAKPTS